jgi:hypothetical protein
MYLCIYIHIYACVYACVYIYTDLSKSATVIISQGLGIAEGLENGVGLKDLIHN